MVQIQPQVFEVFSLVILTLATHELGHHGIHFVLCRKDVTSCHFLILFLFWWRSLAWVSLLFFLPQSFPLFFQPLFLLLCLILFFDFLRSLLSLGLEERVDNGAFENWVTEDASSARQCAPREWALPLVHRLDL